MVATGAANWNPGIKDIPVNHKAKPETIDFAMVIIFLPKSTP